MNKMNGMNGIQIDWFDFHAVYVRMKARRMFEKVPPKATLPGHILTLGVFAHAQRREGGYLDAADVIDAYSVWKKIPAGALNNSYEAYRRKYWHNWENLETLIEELSRI